MQTYMKNILKSALVVSALLAVSCDKEPELKVTDKGPDMKISIPESTLMGASLPFEINLNDKIPLSTLKASLSFDGTVVSDITIRTKESGVYKDTLHVPFLANVSDGQADLKFVGQNIEFGITEQTLQVNVSRPIFDYMTLISNDGKEYRLDKTSEKYVYSYTGELPAKVYSRIVSSQFGDDKRTITFGYKNNAIAEGGTSYIPFSNGLPGTYTITFNTLSLASSPFVVVKVNGVEAVNMEKKDEIPAESYGAIVEFTQGQTFTIEGHKPGFSDWTIDPDYLEAINPVKGEFKFLPVKGTYRVVLQTSNKFIRISPTTSTTDLTAGYPVLNDDFSGGLWIIGDETIGKPVGSGVSWNPEIGGLCCSQIEPKKFQITLVAGKNIGIEVGKGFKFFFQRTWGGELRKGSYSEVNIPAEFGITDDGNIGVASTLAAGDTYRFIVDFTKAKKEKVDGSTSATGVVLTCTKLK